MAQEAAQLGHLAVDRARMVEQHIARRGVSDSRPRCHAAGAARGLRRAEDSRCPFEGQTISQPYIVALMIEAAEVRPGDRVLKVGTGSGYAAAVLSRIADRVYTVERHGALVAAKCRFARLGYRNIEVRPATAPETGLASHYFDACLRCDEFSKKKCSAATDAAQWPRPHRPAGSGGSSGQDPGPPRKQLHSF